MEAGFYSDSAVRKTLTAGDGERSSSPGSCDSRLRFLFDAAVRRPRLGCERRRAKSRIQLDEKYRDQRQCAQMLASRSNFERTTAYADLWRTLTFPALARLALPRFNCAPGRKHSLEQA